MRAFAAALFDLVDEEFAPGAVVARLGGDEFAAVVPTAAAHGLPCGVSHAQPAAMAWFDAISSLIPS